MSDENPTPSLADLLLLAGSNLHDGVYTSLPAKVTRWDAAKQAVDAQPTTKRRVDPGDGSVVLERYPVVTNAPVAFPGSGPYRLTWPVAVGSIVLLVFPSTSIDRWLAMGAEVDPADDRKHTLSDAFAIPGGHSFAGPAKPGTTAPTDAMVLHAALLKLGGPASVNVPFTLADASALKAAIAAWPGTGTTDGGASLKAVFAAWNPTGSPRIKVP